MTQISDNLTHIQTRISKAALTAGRDPADITLIAVSKTRTAEEIQAAYASGIRHFGENYLQDALPKIAALRHLKDIQWHFIGALQSNKTRDVAANFTWLHTLDREKIARRLNDQREGMPPLKVCIQVNVDAQPQKAGVLTEDLASLLETVQAHKNLEMCGLMAIPDPAKGESSFVRMAILARKHHCRVLSMGMSGDFEAAILSGATHVRIGTAIFGPRQ